ncbi:hypothetical protein [Segeticoccus rhizosphaerae]|uniref:hypothetical protein n=1 Tax=Segeticoccus rhizosphaerae TaxID=1104777 RepID=UPI0012650A90|nr:hypothetical protein [Segeticoccus rhizosphaerae]
MTTTKPRLAVPVRDADRVWTHRDPTGHLVIQTDTDDRVAPGKWETRYTAGPCTWCGWTHGPAIVKAAAEEQARWHREQHRREGK